MLNIANKRQSENSNVILIFTVMFYIVSAIAFECTPETARISSLAIYVLFMVGGYYVIKKGVVRFNVYIVCALVFCFYIFIMHIPMQNTTNEALAIQSSQILYKNFTCVVLCVIMYMVIYHNPSMIKWVLWACVIGTLILIFRIVRTYDGVSSMLEFASGDGENRVGSEMINANSLGIYANNAIICAITIILTTEKKILKIFMTLVIVLFAGMALLAASKKAVAALIIGIILYIILLSHKENFIKKLGMLILSCLIIGGLIWLICNMEIFSTIKLRLLEMFQTFSGEAVSRTDETRIIMMKEGIVEFWKNPLWGNGTAHSYRIFGTYSHNNFVELLMNYGIVGFMLYYIPYVFLVFKMCKEIGNRDKVTAYFFVYVFVQLFLSIGLVNYYERVMQLIISVAWGYLEGVKIRRDLNEIKECV